MRIVHAPRRLAVFAGPSLPPQERPALEDVTYLPPAARGDVERVAREYDAVLLIDGVFHHDLAPSPKECYAALRHARMFGTASMGALRAAECAPYGFTPLGAIAGWYTHDAIDGDDEVAVLTHPDTHEALTVPLVNVRYVAWLAYRAGIINADERSAFIRSAREIFYMDRGWDDVIELAPRSAREWIARVAVTAGDLKQLDARFALRSVLRARHRLGGWAHRSVGAASTIRQPSRDTSPIMLPASVPKAAGTYDRAVSFARTIAVVPELRTRYGITRVADTTHLDRTGIPTYSALVPHSPDFLGVYNGKGMTCDAAMLSAVMEAAERQAGAAIDLPTFKESLRVIGKRVNLDACGMREDVRDLTVDCVFGTDLLSGEVIPVPLAMVQCPWFGEKLFDTTSTNGLASGNNLTEAIYHALCEVIERHTWAMYHVRCSFLPRFYLGPDAGDVAVAPTIAFPAGEANVDRLVRDVRTAGLVIRALALREEPLPLTVIASLTEPNAAPPMAHMGVGCSLSPAHALTRAITEAVQSRAVDIQAAREDILRADEPAGMLGTHARRLSAMPTRQWLYDVPTERISLAALPDRATDDLALDLRVTLDAVRTYGIQSVIAIDLSPPDFPISVVRVVVPGLETYAFSGYLGSRARAELNPFTLSSAR